MFQTKKNIGKCVQWEEVTHACVVHLYHEELLELAELESLLSIPRLSGRPCLQAEVMWAYVLYFL